MKTTSLRLAFDMESRILYFGAVPLVLQAETDPEFDYDVLRAIFNQLTDMENEIMDLRRWKALADQWIAERPEGL